ncbi:hypothetical protein D3P07_08775 [Paenibacillus sp. 1011MAR3C5]|uniref:hypothetical protein n=1 Tax=Paenibacillus sp. 1011MAR3C5 TaxID=1675787 RepID=UPI000E6C96A7|nr:hypothetical protein [Paenibacillus sp. 1011MAR3C5]RJE90288.1 hypothetical protein D3P07_08775 [Paenibacillus sp. 1011MAR3C5]
MNNKSLVLAVLPVILILSAGFYAYQSTTTAKTKPDDIRLEATVSSNTNPNRDLDYVLDITLTQEADSTHLMYPVITGINRLSYDAKDEELGFFVPTNIALVDKDEPRILDAVAADEFFTWDRDTFYGIWAPAEKGTYKLRAYFNSDQGIEQWHDTQLLYVHNEEGWLGNDLSWSKIIDIRIDL